MSSIKIIRIDKAPKGKKKYDIYIDNNKIDLISEGEKKEIKLTSGRHSIYTKFRWVRSQDFSFEIKDSETKFFIIKPSYFEKKYIIIGIIMIAILKISIGLFKKEVIRPYFIPIILYSIVAFIIMLYPVSFGHKNYMIIDEILEEEYIIK